MIEGLTLPTGFATDLVDSSLDGSGSILMPEPPSQSTDGVTLEQFLSEW